ncbi:uncharacterized protein LOC132886625 isoform X1 [Neoarius graeffei]|uniref:uncharacterized protein LOC132886625 isoform X1 n=1 Tax=Neoarius graeffei TaxID=443677 RepID=UPI00298D41E0|nr:uncharacterized protein LOC132886625 isoform X1 [Neoarius graeffei]
MPEFSQCAWWMFFISILVPFLLCGGRSGCSGHQHPNGTVTFNLDETVPVSQHDTWQINNVVQADEMSFNTTTIESRGLRYVTFKKCYENVTYWSADPGKSISCLCNCSPTVAPIQARNGDNSSVLDVIGRHDSFKIDVNLDVTTNKQSRTTLFLWQNWSQTAFAELSRLYLLAIKTPLPSIHSSLEASLPWMTIPFLFTYYLFLNILE